MAKGPEKACRGCGMKITHITSPAGKSLPAQRVRSIYREAVQGASGEIVLEKIDVADLFVGPTTLYVNHFETCPKATGFHQKKKKD